MYLHVFGKKNDKDPPPPPKKKVGDPRALFLLLFFKQMAKSKREKLLKAKTIRVFQIIIFI